MAGLRSGQSEKYRRSRTDAGAAGEGYYLELTADQPGRSVRGPCRDVCRGRGKLPNTASRRTGIQSANLPSRIAQQFRGARAQRGRVGSGADAVFAQDTPPINASFWVERNAPPLLQIKHLSHLSCLFQQTAQTLILALESLDVFI
jgi:hypothetical protein